MINSGASALQCTHLLAICCNFRGWIIGIDVTVNPEAIYGKSEKLKRLKPLWSAIGIDYGAIALIKESCSVEETTATLRLIIKGATLIEF